jgi:hypothetical protein
MRNEHRLFVGKLDRNLGKTGTRNCSAYVTWSVEDGRFSMSAEVWNHIKSDIIIGGQCVDTVAALFPHHAQLQRMRQVWERWHLDDMKAGSAVQEAWLRAHPIDPQECAYPRSHYEVASARLAEAGLNPDPDGYRYGHAWKTETLPADVLAEIASWDAPAEGVTP